MGKATNCVPLSRFLPRSSIVWNATCLLSVQMAHKSESLIDVVVKLGGLLQRPDLTDDERQRYFADFVKLTRKCLMASEFIEQQKLQVALDLVRPTPGYGVVAAFGLMGMVVLARRWRVLFPLYAFLWSQVAVYTGIFVLGRFRLVSAA